MVPVSSYSELSEVANFSYPRSLTSETRVPGLSCRVVCIILYLAVLVELRLVTDGRTDGQTMAIAHTALA